MSATLRPSWPNTPVGGSCSPPADFDGGGSVGMVRHSVQSKIHRRLRATPDRLPAFRFPVFALRIRLSALVTMTRLHDAIINPNP
jgi:hypothetical protein